MDIGKKDTHNQWCRKLVSCSEGTVEQKESAKRGPNASDAIAICNHEGLHWHETLGISKVCNP